MTPLEQLSIVDELVINRANPGEIRGYLLAIREALEANAALQIEHSKLKDSTAKEIAELKEQNMKLILRNSELNSITKPDNPESSWPQPGLRR